MSVAIPDPSSIVSTQRTEATGNCAAVPMFPGMYFSIPPALLRSTEICRTIHIPCHRPAEYTDLHEHVADTPLLRHRQTVKLYARIIGSGPPVLILHGLFGMSDNWLTIGRNLSNRGFCAHLLDLRNHGRSPHAPTHRYPDMCEDLLAYLERQELECVDIIGHSMGGKLAMIFGLLEPEKTNRLIIVDMAPSDYRTPENTYHAKLLDTLLATDLHSHRSRGSIRAELSARLNDNALASFLAKNVYRDRISGLFAWKINLPVLKKFIEHIQIGLDELEIYAPCRSRTLFIKGKRSTFYLPKHESDRLNFFPNSVVITIDDAGHWVHSEQPDRFLDITAAFLISGEVPIETDHGASTPG